MADINYSAEIVKSVQEEFEDYKRAEVMQSKEEIFDNSHVTHFYLRIGDYFGNTEYLYSYFNCKEFSKDTSKALHKYKGTIISRLYDFYLHSDYENVANYEAIDGLIERYVEKYYENAME